MVVLFVFNVVSFLLHDVYCFDLLHICSLVIPFLGVTHYFFHCNGHDLFHLSSSNKKHNKHLIRIVLRKANT